MSEDKYAATVADLIGRLSEGADHMYGPGHRPCLRDCLGDLALDLRKKSDVVLDRIVAIVADFDRAARIDELKLMIGNCIGVGPWDSELAVTMRTLEERIAELEADE